MRSNVLFVSLILTLFVTPFLNAQDSLKFRYNFEVDSTETKLKIPLYETASPFWQDYRVNQSFSNSIKWGSMMTVVGAAMLLNGGEGFIGPLIAVSLPFIGVIGGGFNGYLNGVNLNEEKKIDPRFHTLRKHIGYEAEANTTTIDDITFFNSKGSLSYQPLTIKKYWPSEYRFGLSFNKTAWMGESNNDLYEYEYSYRENRFDFSALYNSNKSYFQFHYGFGGGYSWGENETVNESSITYNKLYGAYVYPLAGITINFNDFIYFRAEGRYELSQFYLKLLDYADYPAMSNLSFGFSFGTYIF